MSVDNAGGSILRRFVAVAPVPLVALLPAAEELYIFGHDAEAAALLPGLLVLPGLLSDSTLNENRPPLAEEFSGCLCGAVPGGYVYE